MYPAQVLLRAAKEKAFATEADMAELSELVLSFLQVPTPQCHLGLRLRVVQLHADSPGDPSPDCLGYTAIRGIGSRR